MPFIATTEMFRSANLCGVPSRSCVNIPRQVISETWTASNCRIHTKSITYLRRARLTDAPLVRFLGSPCHVTAHRSTEDVFPEAFTFDIDRYLPPRSEQRGPGYAPKGLGTHMCLGSL